MIRVVTDSTCDLPADVIEELGITVIPLYINVGDRGYLDGVEITRSDFYTNLPDYEVHPTTGTPGTESFIQAFSALAEDGATEIISIHIAESLSATVQVARTAASQFEGIPVTVRDGGQLSLGTGFQVETAALMAREGRSIDEIMVALDDIGSRTFVAAGLDTLEYLRRSGRMNNILFGIGSLLQLKPILTMEEGEAGSERVRTAEKSEARLIEMLQDRMPIERFALLHTNAAEKAESFRSRIADALPGTEDYSMDITPVIGAHIGPGAVGYAIISEPI
jgi:DegV family protein with EDD domain